MLQLRVNLRATKRRILALLPRGSRTVPELAATLDLSTNTVRTHQAAPAA